MSPLIPFFSGVQANVDLFYSMVGRVIPYLETQ
jgi:hypothetical protein